MNISIESESPPAMTNVKSQMTNGKCFSFPISRFTDSIARVSKRPPYKTTACLRARYFISGSLIARNRSEKQILKVETEIDQRRDGDHLHLIDAAVRFER